MSKATTFIAFTAGAAIGAVASWYFTKKKYEQIAQEEIDSVKETFSKLYKHDETPAEIAGEPEEGTDAEPDEPLSVMEYAVKLRNEGYTQPDVGRNAKPVADDPYVIAPESFDELEGYEVHTFTYYADETLADDDDRVIDVANMKRWVGFASSEELESHFGEHVDDAIYVRNDRLKCDIEILYDRRTYADVLEKEPYKAEV